MTRRRWIGIALAAAGLAALLAASSPWMVSAWWRYRSSNPVRRGIQRAGELGCFHCHGHLGRQGIPMPGPGEESVPRWDGGVWMMYVESDEEIRKYILDGSGDGRREDGPPEGGGSHGQEGHAIAMPAFREFLEGTDLEDLVAAFKAASGMSLPSRETPARHGYDLARERGCLSCHGVAGSGGLPNPGSFTGFIPGWYGADFRDLVRSREEFDAWILHGGIRRLRESPVASFFIRRQRVAMPEYPALEQEDLDALWAYARWLEETEGGSRGGGSPW